jgi:hypothetical protein
MTSTLHVWIIDPQDHTVAPRMDPTPRYVNHAPKDQMRKQAVEHIGRANYKLRSLNHLVDGNMLAYVYPNTQKPKTATKIPGWVYKRTALPAIK